MAAASRVRKTGIRHGDRHAGADRLRPPTHHAGRGHSLMTVRPSAEAGIPRHRHGHPREDPPEVIHVAS